MTAPEFKEKYPEWAHLDGDELWDAMGLAKLSEQLPYIPQPGDEEVVEVVELNGYRFHITKGAKIMFEKLLAAPKRKEGEPLFSNIQFMIFDTSEYNNEPNIKHVKRKPK